MNQWFFKITDYAERLISDLDKVDYPEKTKKQQKHWIGKSNGYEINFGNGVICFTTKPETLLDVEFIVTPLHEDSVEKQIGFITCPLRMKPIPIWTANYVVKGYGTGYVMGVPNDDKRDRDFALRNNIKFNEEKQLIDINLISDFCKPKTNYRLRDWCVSRQRMWGCPIPIEGETDTLDTFVDSSFYTIEYDKNRPVDLYVGGNEHACMHLLYARFITKFLYDIGYINFDEPFLKVIHNGFILGEDGEKMSKTRGNVINPDNYEPQILRMYLMFINHYFEGGKWQDAGYKGCERFRNKLISWINSAQEIDDDIDFQKFENHVINYFEAWKTNKVVSEWMIFYNLNKNKKISLKTAEKIVNFFNTCF
jgi:leucyl-tRNA synthetase